MARRDSVWFSVQKSAMIAPWFLAEAIFRLIYGFRVEGIEYLPARGPFILGINEYSLIAMLISGWMSLRLVLSSNELSENSTVSYMQEELWAARYFRTAVNMASEHYGKLAPLSPHTAGNLALGLLDGFRVLQQGGIVNLNPEGDMPWDGRPLPLGSAMAWLALHTAVPIVPALCSIGAYDIWPRWQVRPYLSGRLVLKIGKPFKLCDKPQVQVSESDLASANARIQAEFDAVRYGPGGIPEWAGPPLRNGLPAEPPDGPALTPRPVALPAKRQQRTSLIRRGSAQLLWQCPICRTNDALVHERLRFRPQTLHCEACGTRWELRRVVGKDFRLKVVEGSPEWLGLDMALSTWYDLMLHNFSPAPIKVSGMNLLPGEEVYLETDHARLLPYRPNALFDGWQEREPPKSQPPGRRDLADWSSIGEGRLLLTSHRLLWQSPERELDFVWPSVTAINMWIVNTLGIRYGTAPYRLAVGQEAGLKWLTHAGLLARQAAQREGRTVVVSYLSKSSGPCGAGLAQPAS